MSPFAVEACAGPTGRAWRAWAPGRHCWRKASRCAPTPRLVLSFRSNGAPWVLPPELVAWVGVGFRILFGLVLGFSLGWLWVVFVFFQNQSQFAPFRALKVQLEDPHLVTARIWFPF